MNGLYVWGICLSLAVAAAPLAETPDLPEWSVRLGWTLVHSTWQLSAIAAVTFILKAGLSRRSARVQYLCSISSMVAALVVPCATWGLVVVPASHRNLPQPLNAPLVEPNPQPADSAAVFKATTAEDSLIPNPEMDARSLAKSGSPLPDVGGLRANAIQAPRSVKPTDHPKPELGPKMSFAERIHLAIVPWLGFINVFWFAGVLLLSLRPVWGLWMQFRLRCVGLTSVPDDLRLRLEHLAERLGVACAVRISVSTLAKTPMVVGYLRPMILLPASVITGLTFTELEALLAHELAHIRRHDWIVNALQVVVETLMFHHPAIWWLSHRIRHERELCCDDLALTLIPDKAQYGRMLLVLEELLHHSPAPALAATGGNLIHRIRRLAPAAKPTKHSFNGWLAALVVLCLTGTAGGLSVLSAQSSPVEETQISASDPKDKSAQSPRRGSESKETAGRADGERKQDADAQSVEQAPPPKSAIIAVASHDMEYSDPIIDLSSMTIHESHWYTTFPVTRLYQDRWLRSRGYGDLSRGEDGKWVGFRGALLLVLDEENLEEAVRLPVDRLKARIVAEGRVDIAEDEFIASKCLAIQAGSGHVYVGKLMQPFPWSLKFDLRRLTADQDGYLDRPNDGIDAVAWGPVADGLQAGIVYRLPDPKAGARRMVGDIVSVKLFVRNASQGEKTYSWQLEDENYHLEPVEKAERTQPTLPIFHSWQPILADAAGRRATISPPPDHQKYLRYSATLKPGEAVFVGAAASSLWSAIDVDFGVAGDRLNAVMVAPGEYRLSTIIDTGLASSPKLLTGELTLQVVDIDPVRSKILAALDALPRERRNRNFERYWSEAPDKVSQASPDGQSSSPRDGLLNAPDESEQSPSARPLLGRAPVEYLTLPGLVVDDESKQPLEGALVTISIEARSDSFRPELCQYQLATDKEGRFEAKIPRKLLSGYAKEYKGAVQLVTRHVRYSRALSGETIDNLQALGLVGKDGGILKQGQRPTEPEKSSNLSELQLIALRPGRTISGRLMSPDNQPLTNVTILGNELTSFGFPSAIVLEQTDSEGRFQFDVPAKATVYLDFRARGLPDKEVKVLPDRTELGDVLAAEGMKIRGQVLDADGKPVAHVSMTAPPVARSPGDLVSIFRTDEQGRFESHLIPPGEYQLVVGDIDPPDDSRRKGIRLSGPPPDLYLPYPFQVKSGVPLPEVTLKPAASAIITATLVTTANSADEKGTDAFDVMMLKAALQKPLKVTVNGKDVEEEKRPELRVTADANTGKISVKGDPDNQWAMTLAFLCEIAETPYFSVKGSLDGKPWSANTNVELLAVEPDEPGDSDSPATKQLPNTVSLKAPRNLTDLTVETGYPFQHLQVGSGPKLFGNKLRIPRLDANPLELKIYRYKATTLRIRLRDAEGKPVVMKDDKLPEGVSIKPRFVREDEVRQAGAVLDPPEQGSLMIQDNEAFVFAVPGEAIDVTVTFQGKDAVRQFTLEDGETRTAELQLGPTPQWTETSKPTPKVEFEE